MSKLSLTIPRVLPSELGVINRAHDVSGFTSGGEEHKTFCNKGDIVRVVGVMYTEDQGVENPASNFNFIEKVTNDDVTWVTFSQFIDPLPDYLGDNVHSRLNVFGTGVDAIGGKSFDTVNDKNNSGK